METSEVECEMEECGTESDEDEYTRDDDKFLEDSAIDEIDRIFQCLAPKGKDCEPENADGGDDIRNEAADYEVVEQDLLDDLDLDGEPSLVEFLSDSASTRTTTSGVALASGLKRLWKDSSDIEVILAHLCFVARKGLSDLNNEYEVAFSAIHLLALLIDQLPIKLIKDPGGKCFEKIILTAYQCSSVKLREQEQDHSNEFEILFRPEVYNFESKLIIDAFYNLASTNFPHKMAAMKYAGDFILDKLRAKLHNEDQIDGLNQFNSILSESRKTIIDARVNRTVTKAIKKSQGTFVNKKKKNKTRSTPITRRETLC